ncbi:beta-ketoacyl-ACP synthase II [Marinicella gelatinilytica]|uniref:beta-ketoacyl-ACP synthase II n=1 Tax=Marinicella gelatinilytica TaxID=2996017 RepID=UPI002260F0BE|nr:beta-ketoacyl-ACP synthase II [Marinicella gelatinilytica]MCX7544638.1 beta-ketoacyl-ACP synthase II [Marinicella gelatinilytica]
MQKRRVVVTGMGIVSPVGNQLATAWDNILKGVSGIGAITHFDTTDFTAKIAGEVKDFDVSDYLSAKESKKMDPFIHYAMAAGIDAFEDAKLQVTENNAERIGVYIGAGIGGILGIQETTETWLNKGPRRISPFFIPSTIINMASGNLSIKYGLKGPNLAMVSACSSATHSIGMAYRSIQYGDADVMICGGAEYASTPIAIGGFSQSKALSTRNDEPDKASRPWDQERDGFVLGDGAGVLVLETLEHAQARGARIYAEIVGFGMSSDAHHMTAPSPGGEGAARCMVNAVKDSGLDLQDFDYINAHGTSTPQGDVGESDAIKTAFGSHAYNLAVSSTKSMTGHLLGAAGGIEAIFSILAIRDQILPPTINLDNPDPACDLDYVPHKAKSANINAVMSNSFGFGGTNGSIVFKRIP